MTAVQGGGGPCTSSRLQSLALHECGCELGAVRPNGRACRKLQQCSLCSLVRLCGMCVWPSRAPRYKRVFAIGTKTVATYNPNTHEVTNQVSGKGGTVGVLVFNVLNLLPSLSPPSSLPPLPFPPFFPPSPSSPSGLIMILWVSTQAQKPPMSSPSQ